MKKYTVKELSSIAGINSQTLRRYEALGIVKPERNEENQYRLYEWRDFVQLLRIRSLRNYGLGLPEISDIYETDANGAAELFAAHLNGLDEQIALLTRQRALAAQQHRRLQDWRRLWENGFEVGQQPACVLFPYRYTHGEAMVEEGMRGYMDSVTEYMPPLRSCTVVGPDTAAYSGLYAYAYELPEHLLNRGIHMPAGLCVTAAMSGVRAKVYRSSLNKEKGMPRWSVEAVNELLAPHGWQMAGAMITEVLHMEKLPEDGVSTPMECFRSYQISHIPVNPITKD